MRLGVLGGRRRGGMGFAAGGKVSVVDPDGQVYDGIVQQLEVFDQFHILAE